MKNLSLYPFSFFALAASVRAGEKKGLLIMLDGLRGDAALSASTPSIDSLRLGTWAEGYHGAYTYEAYTILDANPSSATNHVSIMTGVTATKHGCYNNGQTALAKYDEYPAMSTLIVREKPDTVGRIYWDENRHPHPRDLHCLPTDNKIFNDALSFVKGTFVKGWNPRVQMECKRRYRSPHAILTGPTRSCSWLHRPSRIHEPCRETMPGSARYSPRLKNVRILPTRI